MTFGIFYQRYPVPRQLGRGRAGVGYRARSTAVRNGGTSQMYRNDLCTWLDVLSPRHAWPPSATSLSRNAKRRAQLRENNSWYSSFEVVVLDARQNLSVLLRASLIFYRVSWKLAITFLRSDIEIFITHFFREI